MRRRACAALALAALACGPDPQTPEERVRAVFAAMETAAQERDVAALKEHVSEAYGDARGHDKREIGALAGMHLLRNESVHLLTRVRGVEIGPEGEARAIALVAMAGAPIPGPELLPTLRADLYRFDVELREEDGAWRITRAEWRPASLAEF